MDTAESPSLQQIAGVELEIARRGRGRPLLFLHPHLGLHGAERFIDDLAREAEVIAPSHPGFGRSALPKGLGTVDDLAYFYLDLIEQLGLKDVALVGSSFGAWIAMEIATKTTERISSLVLLDAVGAKFGERERSDVVDIFATPRANLEELYYHRPGFARTDLQSVPEEELERIARNMESTAHFAWTPYMYDPKLRARLHRVRIPTLLLWGAQDRIAPPAYGRRYAEAIPGARFEEIAGAGHFPHIECPEEAARRVSAFALSRAPGSPFTRMERE
jgi:pimeloyl-ACP methyl ester carboxylesterase